MPTNQKSRKKGNRSLLHISYHRLRLESPVKRSGDYLFLKFLFSRPRVRPNQCLPKLMAAYGGFFSITRLLASLSISNLCVCIKVDDGMEGAFMDGLMVLSHLVESN